MHYTTYGPLLTLIASYSSTPPSDINLRLLRNVLMTLGMKLKIWAGHLMNISCGISRKVAGSIPDGVIGIFHWHNPFGRTMALGSTQSLTEMSTRNISWGVKAAGA
jgi:hypothetical protein